MNIGRLKINLAHLLAFVFGMIGILGTFIGKALEGGTVLTVAMVLSGTGGLIWALFQHTILPDIEGGSGTVSKSLGSDPKTPRETPAAKFMTDCDVFGGGVSPYRVAAVRLEQSRRVSFRPYATGALFFVVMLVSVLFLPAASCEHAVAPVAQEVEQIVLNDIEHGVTSAEQIEVDVASALGGAVGVDLVELVNSAITILIDTGAIPASFLAAAKKVQTDELTKLAARAHK
jgi:hypothetical protein